MDTADEQCRDVYAHFGLAIYAAQCLEQAMIHSLVMMDHFPRAVPNFTTREKWELEFDVFFEQEASRTMGQLIGRLQKIGAASAEIETNLKASLIKRNWLAHSYFSDRALEFMSEKGRKSMIKELEDARDDFYVVDNQLSQITRKIAQSYGITDKIFDELMEQMLRESNSDL